jgi:hypothetical protein
MGETQDYLLNRRNAGFGLDLGATYQLNDKIDLNFSIVDLGFINWKSDVKNYVNDGSTFEFSGIDIDDFILKNNVDTSKNSSLQRVLDSLGEAFNLEEKNEAYRSNLIAQIYIGGSYQLSEKGKAGALIQSEYFKGKLNPSITLSYNHKFTKWFHATASYTVINNSYNNIGGGFVVHPGPVQLYIVADNILGAIQPQNARHMQVRAGINLVFGKGKINDVTRQEKKKSKKVIEEELIPVTPTEKISPEKQEFVPIEETDTIPEIEETPEEIIIEEVDSIPSEIEIIEGEEIPEETIIEGSSIEQQELDKIEVGDSFQEENTTPSENEITPEETIIEEVDSIPTEIELLEGEETLDETIIEESSIKQ